MPKIRRVTPTERFNRRLASYNPDPQLERIQILECLSGLKVDAESKTKQYHYSGDLHEYHASVCGRFFIIMDILDQEVVLHDVQLTKYYDR